MPACCGDRWGVRKIQKSKIKIEGGKVMADGYEKRGPMARPQYWGLQQ